MTQIGVFFNAFHSAFSIFQKSEALLAAGFRDNSVTWELIFLLLKKYNSLPPHTHNTSFIASSVCARSPYAYVWILVSLLTFEVAVEQNSNVYLF